MACLMNLLRSLQRRRASFFSVLEFVHPIFHQNFGDPGQKTRFIFAESKHNPTKKPKTHINNITKSLKKSSFQCISDSLVHEIEPIPRAFKVNLSTILKSYFEQTLVLNYELGRGYVFTKQIPICKASK